MALSFAKRALTLCGSLAFVAAAGLTCLDEQGQPVDRWFVIKEPSGTAYLYFDGASNSLSPSPNSLNSTTTGALAYTLNQLWTGSNVEYLMFNDEPLKAVPNASLYTDYGHTKGVWAWDTTSNQGVILQHSIPLFPHGPGLTPTYTGLGGNAYTYAQHLACFTVGLNELNTLAGLAPLTAPDIYDQRTSAQTPSALAALAAGTTSTQPDCNTVSIQTAGGLNVTYFAKSAAWNSELYSQCIAPTLHTNLLTETWIRGDAEGPSCSGSQQVLDVKKLMFTSTVGFTETDDHSKWAVSPTGSIPWLCPADINRMTTQYKRGGSAFCFQDVALVSAIRNAITSVDAC